MMLDQETPGYCPKCGSRLSVGLACPACTQSFHEITPPGHARAPRRWRLGLMETVLLVIPLACFIQAGQHFYRASSPVVLVKPCAGGEYLRMDGKCEAAPLECPAGEFAIHQLDRGWFCSPPRASQPVADASSRTCSTGDWVALSPTEKGGTYTIMPRDFSYRY